MKMTGFVVMQGPLAAICPQPNRQSHDIVTRHRYGSIRFDIASPGEDTAVEESLVVVPLRLFGRHSIPHTTAQYESRSRLDPLVAGRCPGEKNLRGLAFDLAASA